MIESLDMFTTFGMVWCCPHDSLKMYVLGNTALFEMKMEVTLGMTSYEELI